MIKSISYEQDEILNNIKELYCPDGFECDLTYGNGAFYKNIGNPKHCLDLQPLHPNVIQASSTSIPFADNSLNNIVFDPPFLCYIKNGREHNSIMGKRFSGYWNSQELEDHYVNTLKEVSRVLKKKGILVFKCQDLIYNHKMLCTHNNVINWGKDYNLFLEDMFILAATHRMPTKFIKQQHARIFHSYFLVLKKG